MTEIIHVATTLALIVVGMLTLSLSIIGLAEITCRLSGQD